MKKGYIKIFIFEVILFIALLFNSFVFKIGNLYIISAILLVAGVISFFMFGYEKDNFRYKKDVFLNTFIILLCYYFITYLLGFFVGFLSSPYSLRPSVFFINTFPVIVLILVTELLRYLIFSKIKEQKSLIVLAFLIFVMIDINAMIGVYDLGTSLGLMKLICLVIFPSITKNLYLSYVTMKVGYKNCIFYRVVMEIPTYFLPLFPDFGDYINVLLETVLPIFILFKINNLFNYNEERKIKSSRYNSKKLVFYSFITFFLLIIVMLTSGYFKYFAIAVGSGSMAPEIEKGDVVIVKKTVPSKVKKGQILVYNHDGKMIVHRVVSITTVENKIYFVTKGDNNNSKDSYLIKEDDALGVTSFKIKYIGMPTVALNELLSK